MFGLEDFSVALAYLLLLIVTGVSVIYGIRKWNAGKEPGPEELEEEKKWMKHNLELEEEVSDGGVS
ncbi:MAG: hypothetical protein K9L68_05435 [Spirochaetales bacterium]|nr:hypothetical protein [Spirochaetales bacterium]MCF7938021.1 hypothetical protein [Spirochaetales bacterium]